MDVRFCDIFRPVDEDAYLRDFIRAVEHKDYDYVKFVVPMIKQQKKLVMTDTDDCGHYLQLTEEDNSRYETILSHGLLLASHHGALNIAEYLIRQGTNVNACNKNGDTPLIKACERGHVDLVNLLLTSGAKVNQVNLTGSSALQWISRVSERLNIVEMLLAQPDIDIDLAAHKKGLTALHIASEHDTTGEIARVLIAKNATVNQPSNDGSSALHRASIRGNYKAAKHLIENGAYVNMKTDKGGQTALHLAMRYGHLDVYELLIKCGAKHDLVDNYGRTPLQHMQIYSRWDNSQSNSQGPILIGKHLEEHSETVQKQERDRMVKMFSTLCELITEHLWTPFLEELYRSFESLEETVKSIPLRTSEVSLSILLQFLLNQWLVLSPLTSTFWILNRALRDHGMSHLAARMVTEFWS